MRGGQTFPAGRTHAIASRSSNAGARASATPGTEPGPIAARTRPAPGQDASSFPHPLQSATPLLAPLQPPPPSPPPFHSSPRHRSGSTPRHSQLAHTSTSAARNTADQGWGLDSVLVGQDGDGASRLRLHLRLRLRRGCSTQDDHSELRILALVPGRSCTEPGKE
ncbi:hypothetical protein DFH09DRAFT_1317144 [Mycena vulgaris]|nr:hypothetical protein DFH09DRAFT_1317144 [Mycena vulgaris]